MLTRPEPEKHIIGFFSPFHPGDVIRRHSAVYKYFVWVRVRVRVSSIHDENHNNAGHPPEPWGSVTA